MTPGNNAGQRTYKAFISHSHQDQALAKRLHRKLETYRPPRSLKRGAEADAIPRRLAPVFRDEDELPAESNLGAVIQRALAASEFLIVLCSPAAARSRWVQQEILDFKRLGRADHVLSVIVDGEPGATERDDAEHECFPLALRYEVDDEGRITDRPVEPSASDLRPGKGGFALALAKICARILGVPLDDLLQRERARRQRRWTVGLALTAALLTALGLGIRQVRERQRRDALQVAQLEAANLLRAGERPEAVARLASVARSGEPGLAGPDRLGVLLAGLVPLERILGELAPHDVFEWQGATYALDADGRPLQLGRFDTEVVFVSEEHDLAVLIRPDTSLETYRLPGWERLADSMAEPAQVPEAIWRRTDRDELVIAGRFSSGSSSGSILLVHWTVDLLSGDVQKSDVLSSGDPEFGFLDSELPEEWITPEVRAFRETATPVTPLPPTILTFPRNAREEILWSKEGASGIYLDVHRDLLEHLGMDPEETPEYAYPYERNGPGCSFVVGMTIYGGMGGVGYTGCELSAGASHGCQEFGFTYGSGEFRGAVVTPGGVLALHGYGLESEQPGSSSSLYVLSGNEPLYAPMGLDTSAEILDLAFSPSGTQLAIRTVDGVVLYDVQDPALRTLVRGSQVPDTAALTDYAFLDEDLLVVLRGEDLTLEALPLNDTDAPPWPALVAIPSTGPDQEAVDPVLTVDARHDWIGVVDRAGGALTVFDGRLGVQVTDRFVLPYERLPFDAVPELSAEDDGTLRLRWGEVTWTRASRPPHRVALHTGILPEAPDRPVATLGELFEERAAD